MVRGIIIIGVLSLGLFADNMDQYKAPPKYEPHKNYTVKEWERPSNTGQQPWMKQEVQKKQYKDYNNEDNPTLPNDYKEHGFTVEFK